MQRRKLLKFGVAAASLTTYPVWAATAQSGRKLESFGLQLSTVTPLMLKDFEGTIARVAEIGYREVEFSAMGFLGRPVEYVQSLLAENQLSAGVGRVVPRLPEGFFALPMQEAMGVYRQRGGLEFFIDNVKHSLDIALAMNQKFLNLPAFMPDAFTSLDGVKRVVDLLNEAGDMCAEQGVLFGYHNHDWEFAEVEGVIPFDYMLANTPADKVGYQLDVYWVTKAGHDPVSLLGDHAGRFPSLHLKDIDAQGDFANVGSGLIDFPRVVRAALKQNTSHFFVERDNPPTPESAIVESYNYLSKMTY
jgi:sugar phosphate isomerase/epimerase